MPKALFLYSGSLASRMALRLAQEVPGLELRLVYFRSPFFREEGRDGACLSPHSQLPLRTKSLKRDYLRISRDGERLPFPCGVCRRVLLSRAARLLRRMKVDFIITGEVVGKGGVGDEELAFLDTTLKLTGRVIRPLSARLLPPTWPELKGLWPGEALWDLEGKQDGLEARAREWGISSLSGELRRCLLADPVYRARFLAVSRNETPTVNTLRLLEFKHFFFLPPDLKVVVALEPREQTALQALFLPCDVRLYLPIPRSPLVLARTSWSHYSPEEREQALERIARLALHVAGFPPGETYEVCSRFEWEEETSSFAVSCPEDSPPEPALLSGGVPKPQETRRTLTPATSTSP
jgi:hypothetical protein